MTLHLLKLCVGISDISQLKYWVDRRTAEAAGRGGPAHYRHVTRHRPRRGPQIAGKGSLYWVISGSIQVRQPIVGFEEVIGEDGIRRCAIVMAPGLIATRPVPRRPFQGWRYLQAGDAPADLGGVDISELPASLRGELAGLGLL